MRLTWPGVAARLLLAATLVLICLPLAPLMPAWGLDASFALAVNQAQADGLVFGQNVIFTLGPYAALYSGLYHPGTDSLMLAAAALLACGYATVVWQLRPQALAAGVAALLLASLFTSRDALLLCYPLLALVALLRGRCGAVLLGAPLGLLLLTKGSLLPLCGLVLISAAVALLIKKERWRALQFVGGALLAVPVLWLLAGQPLAALPAYWLNQLPVIAGFAEAMSADGPLWQVLLWLAVAGCLGLVALLRRGRDWAAWVCLLNLAALLFVAFKAGFVRHDMHAVIASDSLLLLACLLLGWGQRRWLQGLCLLPVLMCWQMLDVMYPYADRPPLQARAVQFYLDKAEAVVARVRQPGLLEARYQAALERLQQRYAFPRFAGGVDIYSANQAELLASGNRWRPRPVFQSYSAYTPGLLALNRDYLLSAQAPDDILFKIEAIDQRLPALEDGASWPLLLTHYQLESKAGNGYLYLARREHAGPVASSAMVVRMVGQLGQAVVMPRGQGPLLASVRVHKSAYGRLLGLLYKTEVLRIGLQLADGRHLDYRFVPGMAQTPFLFSPFVGATEDFARLAEAGSEEAFAAGGEVVALNLYCPGGCPSWLPEYELELSPVQW